MLKRAVQTIIVHPPLQITLVACLEIATLICLVQCGIWYLLTSAEQLHQLCVSAGEICCCSDACLTERGVSGVYVVIGPLWIRNVW